MASCAGSLRDIDVIAAAPADERANARATRPPPSRRAFINEWQTGSRDRKRPLME
jgi:hypothetical protein